MYICINNKDKFYNTNIILTIHKIEKLQLKFKCSNSLVQKIEWGTKYQTRHEFCPTQNIESTCSQLKHNLSTKSYILEYYNNQQSPRMYNGSFYKFLLTVIQTINLKIKHYLQQTQY